MARTLNLIMKKICLSLIAIAFAINFSYAQQIGSSPVYYNGSNVGVGNTTPAYPLDVAGVINATGNIIAPSINSQYIGYGYGGITSILRWVLMC
jgi:hypothetical protein